MDLGEYLPVLQRTNRRCDGAATEAVLAHGWSTLVPADALLPTVWPRGDWRCSPWTATVSRRRP
jgi:hypothetical protein